MSQKTTRAAASVDEKPQPSPVQDMKKKMAANAEKQAMEKNGDKAADKKTVEKQNGDKKAEKPAEKQNGDKKVAEKAAEKKVDKPTEKKVEKPAEKKVEKPTEKKVEKPVEKKTEVEKKDDNKAQASKPDQKTDDKQKKTEKDKPKENGKPVHNGVTDVTLASNRGPDEVLNGSTVSADSDDDDILVVIDDHENDELFPELTYDDDTSDAEGFEVPTPESLSRSMTRRSQVKATRTPETPRPASDKPVEGEDKDSSKETKVLKLKDDATERKLRSTDPPKRAEKVLETPKKQDGGQENGGTLEVVVVIEDCEEATRKPDTNFSKSRVKVSPYRRSGRLADQTASSILANYTGNNTTMEMDITESSINSETPTEEGSYIQTIRSIRGRRSYKPYAEIKLTARANRSLPHASADSTRPTLPVVGRKRKPGSPEPARAAPAPSPPSPPVAKRMRLLERVMSPFRRAAAVPSSTPLPARRSAQIVGINTDLPMSAPVAPDPETVKAASASAPEQHSDILPPLVTERDGKRCAIV